MLPDLLNFARISNNCCEGFAKRRLAQFSNIRKEGKFKRCTVSHVPSIQQWKTNLSKTQLRAITRARNREGLGTSHKNLVDVASPLESLKNDDGNVNENVEKQWIKLQNTITARGNATTRPLFRRRL